jgi:hypothetical protein
MAPKGPYKLCTVNKVPERAKLIVGRFIESVKDTYIIDHADNAASMFALSSLFLVCKLPAISRLLGSSSIMIEAKYSNCEQG